MPEKFTQGCPTKKRLIRELKKLRFLNEKNFLRSLFPISTKKSFAMASGIQRLYWHRPLETSWFRSPLCRNRHNLFGLTNPKTGKYYEFNHWTESVRAYYTKVQYKYKGGNYLLWLHKIGYAEDPRYVREVMKVVSQL